MRRCGLTERLSRLAGQEPGRQFRLGFALAKVKDDRFFIPLRRLVRWASNNVVEPEDIDDAALGRYRKELKLRLPESGGEDPPDHLQPLAAPAVPPPGPLWHPKRATLFWWSYDLLRVRDGLAIYLRAHDRRESGLAAGEPGQNIHQLCDQRRRIEVHHHEGLAPCRIAIKGLWTEPLDYFGKYGTRPLPPIDGIGSLHRCADLYQIQHASRPFRK